MKFLNWETGHLNYIHICNDYAIITPFNLLLYELLANLEAKGSKLFTNSSGQLESKGGRVTEVQTEKIA
jgi:hypothetical protein